MRKLPKEEAALLKHNNATSRLFILLYKLGIYTPLNPLLKYFDGVNGAVGLSAFDELPTHMYPRKNRRR